MNDIEAELYHIGYNLPMLFSLLQTNPLVFAIYAGLLLLSLTIHEFAHAFTADKLGDPTPRYQGRVTLNPLKHLDPLGTLMLLFVGFGWGKPVMFDPYNLKHPVRDTGIIAFAGPASNIFICVVLAILYNLLPLTTSDPGLVNLFFTAAISLNVMLAVFNLVPVFPLDGEKIITALLPKQTGLEFHQFMSRYGMFVLLALLIPWGGVSPISRLISPIIAFVTNLFI